MCGPIGFHCLVCPSYAYAILRCSKDCSILAGIRTNVIDSIDEPMVCENCLPSFKKNPDCDFKQSSEANHLVYLVDKTLESDNYLQGKNPTSNDLDKILDLLATQMDDSLNISGNVTDQFCSGRHFSDLDTFSPVFTGIIPGNYNLSAEIAKMNQRIHQRAGDEYIQFVERLVEMECPEYLLAIILWNHEDPSVNPPASVLRNGMKGKLESTYLMETDIWTDPAAKQLRSFTSGKRKVGLRDAFVPLWQVKLEKFVIKKLNEGYTVQEIEDEIWNSPWQDWKSLFPMTLDCDVQKKFYAPGRVVRLA